MTDREKAIVMAYTGICMLTGDKFQIFHEYIEDIMGRPIMTHEIGWFEDSIKEKSKADFIALCVDESRSENPNKWIGAEVLDKIRAEIDEQYDRVHPYDISCAEGLEMALGIIDKYKAESEGAE